MQILKGYNFITRDLNRASCLTKSWKKLIKNQIIFNIDDMDFGYYLERNKIIKVTGNFDTKKDKWIKKTKSLIMTDVISLNFTPLYQKKNILKGINLDIKCLNDINIKCVIAMRADKQV